jgi:hypothetical protein
MVHIYFDAEEDDANKHAAPAAQNAASTSAPTVCARCCARVRVDYTEQDPCYVFEAVCSPDNSTVAASTSQNTIKLYSCAPTQLAHQGDLAAHNGTITQIRFPLQQHPNALYSCSRDGAIKAWDVRTWQLAERWGWGYLIPAASFTSAGAGPIQACAPRVHDEFPRCISPGGPLLPPPKQPQQPSAQQQQRQQQHEW